jgi:hypothetical protein
MFKKLINLVLIASVFSLTLLVPLQSHASGQFEWVGSYNCNQLSRYGTERNTCYGINSNSIYDLFGSSRWGPAWALRPLAKLNRAVACNNFARENWNKYANYGEPGPIGQGIVKCWNKRW